MHHLQILKQPISLYLNFTPQLQYVLLEISCPVLINKTSKVMKQSSFDASVVDFWYVLTHFTSFFFGLGFNQFNNGFHCTKDLIFPLTFLVNI